MPLFEYKGKDAEGQPLSGTIEAASYVDAQTALRDQSVQVVMLRPALAFADTPILPAEPPKPKPSSVDSSGFSLRAPGFQKFVIALLGLALVALLGGGIAIYKSFAAWGRVGLRKREIPRVLQVKGRLDFATPSKEADPWRNAHIAFSFPEVPAEFIASREDLAINAVGDFDIKIYYLSRVPVSTVNIRASCPGFRPRRQLNVAVPQEPDSPVQLSPITLRRAVRVPTPGARFLGPRRHSRPPAGPPPGTTPSPDLGVTPANPKA